MWVVTHCPESYALRMKMAEFRTVRLIGTLLDATLVLSGCQKKGDAISSAEQTEKINGIAAPGISETKAIAEEGFIYGLPLVMSYAIMNAYSINRSSSSFTAPVNQIFNESRVYTSSRPRIASYI
jgi:hypothetical protein